MKIWDVYSAQKDTASYVYKTPVFHSQTTNDKLGLELFLKCENLQKTGSFKIRGAANFLLQKQKENKQIKGVVAASSGNHGQAVSYIAGKLKIPAVIVMPEGATPAKVNASKSYGAKVEFCGRTSADRLKRAKEIASELDYIEVPPYDHESIIAGQGTIGIELLEQLPQLEAVFVPVGGGGLISGIAFTIKELRPDIHVIGVEPKNSNSMYESFFGGSRVSLDKTDSIADGLLSLSPGELTYEIAKKYVDEIILVTEEEIKSASKSTLERFKLLAEPSGAVSIAGASQNNGHRFKKVAAVLSGGNADLSKIGAWIS